MIATAPLYTGKRVRTHTTKIGRILCTGKGCIGCSAKQLGNKSVREVLGDVDAVEFNIRNGSALISRPITAPGCYGNDGTTGFCEPIVENKKIRKLSPRRKENNTDGIVCVNGRENSVKKGRQIGLGNDEQMCKSILAQWRGDCLWQESNAEKQHRRVFSPSLLNPRRRKNVRLLTRNGKILLDVKTSCANLEKTTSTIPRVTKLSVASKPQTNNFLSMLKNSKRGKEESKQGQNTIKNTINFADSDSKMSFLEMLQKSEAGIYDVKAMEQKRSSQWVSKILETGVCSEKELLPRTPSAKATSMMAKAVRFKRGLYKGRVEVSDLPKITLNDRFLYEGEDTVKVIEHENESSTRKDESLHQLSFKVECSSVRRSLPRFSVLDIAEGLGELVSMDSVQIIQRKGRKWNILVKGSCVKDFLMSHGVVVKGRRLQMLETAVY